MNRRVEASGVFISWETTASASLLNSCRAMPPRQRPARRRGDAGRHDEHPADRPPVKGDLLARDALDQRGVEDEKLHAPRGQRRRQRDLRQRLAQRGRDHADAAADGSADQDALAVFVDQAHGDLGIGFALVESLDAFAQMLAGEQQQEVGSRRRVPGRARGMQGEERLGQFAEVPPARRTRTRQRGETHAAFQHGGGQRRGGPSSCGEAGAGGSERFPAGSMSSRASAGMTTPGVTPTASSAGSNKRHGSSAQGRRDCRRAVAAPAGRFRRRGWWSCVRGIAGRGAGRVRGLPDAGWRCLRPGSERRTASGSPAAARAAAPARGAAGD